MRIVVILFLGIGCAAFVGGTASAQSRSEVINGATCIPYPPYGSSNNKAVPYRHWLYGFGQSAFCHITMTNEWQVEDIAYVLVQGSAPDSFTPISIRLCVYASGTGASCSTPKNLTSIQWVALPSSMPAYAQGAYVSIGFPADKVSAIFSVMPVWSK